MPRSKAGGAPCSLRAAIDVGGGTVRLPRPLPLVRRRSHCGARAQRADDEPGVGPADDVLDAPPLLDARLIVPPER